MPLLKQGKNVLIVAHGNSIRAMMKYIEGLNETQVTELEMLFGQILLYSTDEEGLMVTKTIETTGSPPPNA